MTNPNRVPVNKTVKDSQFAFRESFEGYFQLRFAVKPNIESAGHAIVANE